MVSMELMLYCSGCWVGLRMEFVVVGIGLLWGFIFGFDFEYYLTQPINIHYLYVIYTYIIK